MVMFKRAKNPIQMYPYVCIAYKLAVVGPAPAKVLLLEL